MTDFVPTLGCDNYRLAHAEAHALCPYTVGMNDRAFMVMARYRTHKSDIIK